MRNSSKTAHQLVARMLATYADADAYADRGAVISSDGRRKVVFETAFVRGRRFRFHCREHSNEYVVWSDGVHTYTEMSVRSEGPEIIDDGTRLALPIGAAAALSAGASLTVPAMLLPKGVGTVCIGLAQLGALGLDGEENVNTHRCARVNGTDSVDGPTILWIDRTSHVLRRIVTGHGSGSETTTTYEPSLDEVDPATIKPPDTVRITPRPRKPVAWTGIRIAIGLKQVSKVFSGSPAARCGVEVGDEIEAISGTRVTRFSEAMMALHDVEIGQRIVLSLKRGETTLDVLVPIEAVPDTPTDPSTRPLID